MTSLRTIYHTDRPGTRVVYRHTTYRLVSCWEGLVLLQDRKGRIFSAAYPNVKVSVHQ